MSDTQKMNSRKMFRHRLGRIYYLKHILETLLIRWLSSYASKHLKANEPQVCLFAFDGIANTINVKGIYERELLDTVIGWLHANALIQGAALDIGANIGNHSLYFSKWYDGVFSFEPNPRTFKLLEMNASLVDNIKSFNFGMSDRSGHVTMLQSPENMGGSRIVTSADNTDNYIQIEVRALDLVASEIDMPIGLIKLDVEGHELAALSGARNTILNNQPIILFEQNAADFKNGLSPVIQLLESFGYDSFATVMPSPSLPSWLPKLFKVPLTAVLRFLWGFDNVISVEKIISPAFYSLIVAIPQQASVSLRHSNVTKE
jgi:FkbM family methyltransferase